MSKKEIVNEQTGEINEITEAVDGQDIPVVEGDSIETVMVDQHIQLTDKDLLEIADRMVYLDDLQESQEAQKKAAMNEWGGKIKATEAERRSLAAIYRSGSDVRTHECYMVPDFGSGLMLFISSEDCSLIKERALDNGERQMNINEAIPVPDDDTIPVCCDALMIFDGLDEHGNESWTCNKCGEIIILDPEDRIDPQEN